MPFRFLRICLLLVNLKSIVLVAFASFAAAEPQKPAKKAGEQLKVGLWDKVNQPMHPMLLEDNNARYLFHMTSEPMVILNNKWQWQCRLCKNFPTLENNLLETIHDPNIPYGLKIDIELDEDAKWGDGKAVTGMDVLFTWQVANAVEREFPGKSLFQQIEHVVVDPNNPRRFTLFVRKIQYFYEEIGYFFVLPQHLEKAVWDQHKEEPDRYFEHSKYRTEPTNPGLYNGAFLLANKEERGKVVLTRNPYRQNTVAHFREVLVYALKAHPARKFEMDVIAEPVCDVLNCFNLAKEAGKNIGTGTKAKPRLVYGDTPYYEHIDLNLRNPFLRDRNVRKALYHAIDKEKLFGLLMPEEVIPAVGPIHPAHPAFSSEISFYAYDPEKAQELLEQSRWVLNSKGQRVKNDRILALDLVTNRDAGRIKVAKSLIEDWKQVGIKVNHIMENQGAFRQETLGKMYYEALAMYAWDLPVDCSFRSIFHSEAIPNIRNNYIGQNISGWNSYKVDQILDHLDTEFSTGKRDKLFKELQQQYTLALPGIPLYFHMQKALVSPQIEGFAVPGHQYPASAWISGWKRQKGDKAADSASS